MVEMIGPYMWIWGGMLCYISIWLLFAIFRSGDCSSKGGGEGGALENELENGLNLRKDGFARNDRSFSYSYS